MTTSGVGRHTGIDAVRGAIMVVMALDHVREFVHADAMVFNAEDLARTTPILFLTRWVTHVCAPGFAFLAGLAAARRLARDHDRAGLSRYLWTRGLWLVVLELTVMRVALTFRFSAEDPLLLIILVALGVSMMALAALVWLPPPAVLAYGVAVVALHNLLDPLRPADFGALTPLWTLLHAPGVFVVGGLPIVSGYPWLPWTGVMALGFAAGPLYDLEAERRCTILARTGVALVAGFVVLRTLNGYGDPDPWSPQASPTMTVLSFLRTTKYPPSLQFLLMTLGPLLVGLAWAERRSPSPAHPLVAIGRAPLFYYVVHFLLAHLAASSIAAWLHGPTVAFLSGPFPSMGGSPARYPAGFGQPLWVVYVTWVGLVAAMLPLCRWYLRVTSARRRWWGRSL
ncbi:MAG: DUF1624 domain-containing protein [Vicinamibacterales bacterium]